jgi:hypothetical protein
MRLKLLKKREMRKLAMSLKFLLSPQRTLSGKTSHGLPESNMQLLDMVTESTVKAMESITRRIITMLRTVN